MQIYTLRGARRLQLTGQMALQPTPSVQGQVCLPDAVQTVLSGSEREAENFATTLPFESFVAAEAPFILDFAPPPPGVLSTPAAEAAEVATITFQPDAAEGASYILIHEIQTPEGAIYDLTLPKPRPEGALLADHKAGMLYFPIQRLVSGQRLPNPAGPGVLGKINEEGKLPESGTLKHIFQIAKAPIEQTLVQTIAAAEGPGRVLPVNADQTLGKALEGNEAWRSRFAEDKEYRVLLFLHGFGSNAKNSLPRAWLKTFGAHYDALLAYNYPTISKFPNHNAADLLAQIPEELRLKVDIIAHSGGGLVARSLVELQQPYPKFKVQKVLTCGTPHGGTSLADQERWERLVSLGLTAASWLAATMGAGVIATFSPKMLELILRAAGQLIFDLPGLQALAPKSEFLRELNAPSDPSIAQRVTYAAITSTFNALNLPQRNFGEALASLLVQIFMESPNDLIVPTESMSQIDGGNSPLLGKRVYQTDTNHFGYFDKPETINFASTFLLG